MKPEGSRWVQWATALGLVVVGVGFMTLRMIYAPGGGIGQYLVPGTLTVCGTIWIFAGKAVVRRTAGALLQQLESHGFRKLETAEESPRSVMMYLADGEPAAHVEWAVVRDEGGARVAELYGLARANPKDFSRNVRRTAVAAVPHRYQGLPVRLEPMDGWTSTLRESSRRRLVWGWRTAAAHPSLVTAIVNGAVRTLLGDLPRDESWTIGGGWVRCERDGVMAAGDSLAMLARAARLAAAAPTAIDVAPLERLPDKLRLGRSRWVVEALQRPASHGAGWAAAAAMGGVLGGGLALGAQLVGGAPWSVASVLEPAAVGAIIALGLLALIGAVPPLDCPALRSSGIATINPVPVPPGDASDTVTRIRWRLWHAGDHGVVRVDLLETRSREQPEHPRQPQQPAAMVVHAAIELAPGQADRDAAPDATGRAPGAGGAGDSQPPFERCDAPGRAAGPLAALGEGWSFRSHDGWMSVRSDPARLPRARDVQRAIDALYEWRGAQRGRGALG